MLVFVTPKLDSSRIPYSYRARATVPASHIKDSRVTDDITSLHPQLFEKILVESIKIAGIHYCPPNYLRMAMYLELSRPKGDVSRWEKVLK